MTKRYGIATPEDLERQERERRRKEAEYQALLMPDPTQTEPGLETVTPFFDVLSGGVGGLGMKGIAKLGGLLGKRGGHGFGVQVRQGAKPRPENVFDLNRSPYDIHFDEFNALSPTLQARLLRHHNIEPNDLMRHHYDSGGRERLVNLYHYSIRTGQPESAKGYKMLIGQNDARYGYNVETIDPLNRVGRPRKEPPPGGGDVIDFDTWPPKR